MEASPNLKLASQCGDETALLVLLEMTAAGYMRQLNLAPKHLRPDSRTIWGVDVMTSLPPGVWV